MPYKVHMKIDTGMSRVGVQCEELPAFIDYVEKRNMWVEGLMSHFADAWGRPGYVLPRACMQNAAHNTVTATKG